MLTRPTPACPGIIHVSLALVVYDSVMATLGLQRAAQLEEVCWILPLGPNARRCNDGWVCADSCTERRQLGNGVGGHAWLGGVFFALHFERTHAALLSAHITILHDGCLGNARWTNVRSLMCVIIPCAVL